MKGKDEASGGMDGTNGSPGQDGPGRALQLTVVLSRQHVPAGRENGLALLLKLKAAEQQGSGTES